LLLRISKGLALLITLQKQIRDRSISGRPFRVVLAGKPNAGKSSLFNALTGATALVSPEPGTTRDYLVKRLELDGAYVGPIDTAGRGEAGAAIEGQAQALGSEQTSQADLVIWCIEPGDEQAPAEHSSLLPISTKSDLGAGPSGRLATSAVTSEGLA